MVKGDIKKKKNHISMFILISIHPSIYLYLYPSIYLSRDSLAHMLGSDVFRVIDPDSEAWRWKCDDLGPKSIYSWQYECL